MPYSMTAFSRVQKQLPSALIFWEIKSVNHRYLETVFRIPESLRFLEPSLRTSLRNKVSRGKIECQLKIDRLSSSNQSLTVNEELVRALLKAGENIAENHDLANDITVSQVFSWPGVLELRDPAWEKLGDEVEALFSNAVDELLTVRKKEGMELNAYIQSRLELLNQEVDCARKITKSLPSQAREKLQSRLDNIQLNVMDARIEQEVALLLTRLDVSEELDRLQTHIQEVSHIMTANHPIGRRLDFLMQELNREANTLSSKSDSAALTQHAVEMKVLIEQMREQIQNIE